MVKESSECWIKDVKDLDVIEKRLPLILQAKDQNAYTEYRADSLKRRLSTPCNSNDSVTMLLMSPSQRRHVFVLALSAK